MRYLSLYLSIHDVYLSIHDWNSMHLSLSRSLLLSEHTRLEYDAMPLSLSVSFHLSISDCNAIYPSLCLYLSISDCNVLPLSHTLLASQHS